jgi:tRNA pseudouridine32 synthase/23S rRNA pseudouridine746 synthase
MCEGLAARFPGVPEAVWLQRMHNGDVMDDQGRVIAPDTAYEAGRRLYYFRALVAEPRIPFEAVILWQDEHLLVVDKPHFLPVVPSGKYLQETLLIRLKNALGLEALSPIHRIDRDTAGLVLFSKQVHSRGAYQELFRTRTVDKTYECIAPWLPHLEWPIDRESRIEPGMHFMQQAEVPGVPNARTHITPLEVQGNLARYALKPITGKRHQLRVHMAALGLPIIGDGIYPTLTPEGKPGLQPPTATAGQAHRVYRSPDAPIACVCQPANASPAAACKQFVTFPSDSTTMQ